MSKMKQVDEAFNEEWEAVKNDSPFYAKLEKPMQKVFKAFAREAFVAGYNKGYTDRTDELTRQIAEASKAEAETEAEGGEDETAD